MPKTDGLKERPGKCSGLFDHVASRVSHWAGLPLTFFSALLVIVVWAFTGPVFQYSETWQLVINTGTTIVTFLLLFIVQNTQTRDTAALQLKLDAIIYVLTGVDNALIKAEDMTMKELEAAVAEFKKHADESTPDDRAQRAKELTENPHKLRRAHRPNQPKG